MDWNWSPTSFRIFDNHKITYFYRYCQSDVTSHTYGQTKVHSTHESDESIYVFRGGHFWEEEFVGWLWLVSLVCLCDCWYMVSCLEVFAVISIILWQTLHLAEQIYPVPILCSTLQNSLWFVITAKRDGSYPPVYHSLLL